MNDRIVSRVDAIYLLETLGISKFSPFGSLLKFDDVERFSLLNDSERNEIVEKICGSREFTSKCEKWKRMVADSDFNISEMEKMLCKINVQIQVLADSDPKTIRKKLIERKTFLQNQIRSAQIDELHAKMQSLVVDSKAIEEKLQERMKNFIEVKAKSQRANDECELISEKLKSTKDLIAEYEHERQALVEQIENVIEVTANLSLEVTKNETELANLKEIMTKLSVRMQEFTDECAALEQRKEKLQDEIDELGENFERIIDECEQNSNNGWKFKSVDERNELISKELSTLKPLMIRTSNRVTKDEDELIELVNRLEIVHRRNMPTYEEINRNKNIHKEIAKFEAEKKEFFQQKW